MMGRRAKFNTMLSHDPTYLGTVEGVAGSELRVQQAPSVASGVSLIHGHSYRVGQVGSFVRVPQGYVDLYGVISAVGADAVPETLSGDVASGRWLRVELVGESLGGSFERGISQYPNVGDAVHIAIEGDLAALYGVPGEGHLIIGNLSSAESIPARVGLNELVTRHAAILGSTGSGKSTTVSSILWAIAAQVHGISSYASARILMLDVHGEYSAALAAIAEVYSVEPREGQHELCIPYWALDSADLLPFLAGALNDNQEQAFLDKILALKTKSHETQAFAGVEAESITVDTPIPFSLRRLWYELIHTELATFEGDQRDQIAIVSDGVAEELEAPVFRPHGMGAAGPFLNPNALGIRRQLNLLRSRLKDSRYGFLLSPGPWTPDLDGITSEDLDALLRGWLGSPKPITILDLSGVPSAVLERLIGSILRIVYEALYWSREKTEGGQTRPLLVVMEEAHRYVSKESNSTAADMARRIAKEGRKYGVGALLVSQRPSEIDETVLSQCGTLFAMRLTNPHDRARVQGTLPDGLGSLLDSLPILRTGEAIVTGESARLPMRCRISLPSLNHRPNSSDPDVTAGWTVGRREEGYERVVASWRGQSPLAVAVPTDIERIAVDDEPHED